MLVLWGNFDPHVGHWIDDLDTSGNTDSSTP